jgi:hypothetical protein
MAAKIIVLEFNELVPKLLDQFIAEGRLPNFKRLRDESIVATTDAEEKAPNLEPWIQWVTVHSGVPFSQHKCFDLNDGARYSGPRIWDLAARAGRKVWICGSMNAGVQFPEDAGYFLPDPWATDIRAVPESYFEPYLRVVRAYVQEHSSGKPEVTPADMLRFARFMVANGLSPKTVWGTARQLFGELREKVQWRRATILDRLQWDLFRAIYRRIQPDVATFFLNSTAHFQHFHWREMEPEQFSVAPSPDALRTYRGTIAFGYEQMDAIVGEALNLAGPDTSVVLCTGLSQQPMEDDGGRQIFRHRDHASLLAWIGVAGNPAYAPIMSQQFILTFETEEDAAQAARHLDAVRMDDGRPVMLARLDGTKVLTGCMITNPPPEDAMVMSGASNEPQRFWDLFYPLEALRSGMHHPDGVLWIRTPSRQHVEIDRKVSLLELAPTFLALADVRTDHRFLSEPIAEAVEPSAAAYEAA